MIYQLGPRAAAVADALRGRIVDGALRAGDRLPGHAALAAEFGVAPLTMRQVLSVLEEEGLVNREPSRGTFVREQPRVLVVDDEPLMRALLAEQLRDAGHVALPASTPAEAVALLEGRGDIALVLSDIRMPAPRDGIDFIRTVRRRWPALPIAVVSGYAADLASLDGTGECPVLVLRKPYATAQLEEVLRLALPRPIPRKDGRRGATGGPVTSG